MGTCASKFGKRRSNILMIGLDAAGKTTALYQLKMGEVVTTVPTKVCNIVSIPCKGLQMRISDVGGQAKLRELWKNYYNNPDGLIFVVDSNDAARMEEARNELHKALATDGLGDAQVLVLANKMDLPNAMPTSTISERLSLQTLRHNIRVQSCSALTGEGLHEGLEWLGNAISKRGKPN